MSLSGEGSPKMSLSGGGSPKMSLFDEGSPKMFNGHHLTSHCPMGSRCCIHKTG